jgi:spermidine synthase
VGQEKKPRAAALSSLLLLTGLTAVVAQIVLMRELIVLFRGNEISLGLVLAAWLLWTAVGSRDLGRLAARARSPRRVTALLFVLVAAAFPATIYDVRISGQLFAAAPGELLGPGTVLLVCIVMLCAFCALSGCLFAAASRLYSAETLAGAAESTGRLYLIEAAGSAVGGILATILLLRHFSSFEIAFLVAVLNLTVAAALLFPDTKAHAAAVAALALALVLSVPLVKRVDRASLERLWSGFRILSSQDSIYGNLTVVGHGGSRTVYENGVAVASLPDREAAEEAVHYALLEHREPRTMLLIGGGINGSIGQALRHPALARVEYVELDPAIIDLLRTLDPRAWEGLIFSEQVQIHNTDGRLFLKTTRRTYDVIVVNLPEPSTAQLNRFYTLEFFREAARRLRPGGVFSFQIPASENYISPELGALLGSLRRTLGVVFRDVRLIPGETVHFFAANQAGALCSPEELAVRLRQRELPTQYVREDAIRFRTMPDRMRDLDNALAASHGPAAVNRDFSPIAYYYDTTLWAAQFHPVYRRVFDFLARIPFGGIAWSLFAVLAVLAALSVRGGPRAGAMFSAGAMGFCLMGLEILLLLGFQAVYGYVYQQLAILIAMLMAGIALGSWRGLRGSGGMGGLAAVQTVAAATPFLVYAFLNSLAGTTRLTLLAAASWSLFPLLALACGVVGGWQFAIASRLYFRGAKEAKANFGGLYGIDLAGACLGAFAISTYFIPVFGFLDTAAVLAIVALAPALALIISARRTPAR